MNIRKIKYGDILFLVFLALLIIPQTRTPIQVALNKIKIAVWSPGAEPEDKQAQLAPFNYKAQDVEGNMVNLEVANGTITFIGYWATWCPPCIAEMPSIQALYSDYGEKVQFILLTQEEPDRVRQFLKRKGWELPVYFPKMAPPELLRESSIPTNFLINAQGKIVIKETGAADWNSDSVRQLLDGLLENL
jgi:thiol-disulfide isomerase/thioredoxin